MTTWFKQQQGQRLFTAGKDNFAASQAAAANCINFAEDDEDEQIDDVCRSCYNCQYRRWLPDGFQCLANFSN